jgi:hypothetical protein
MINSDKHNIVLVFGINNVHKKAHNIGLGTQNAKKNELENGQFQACQIEVSLFTRFISHIMSNSLPYHKITDSGRYD